MAANELAALLRHVPVGGELPTSPYAEVFTTLEYLMTSLLSRDHGEWAHEAIDGLRFASAVRSGERSADLLGTCILLSDQTVTPFALAITLADQHTISALRLRLGEPGSGQLGISGPSCASTGASTLLMGLPDRVSEIDWTYDVVW